MMRRTQVQLDERTYEILRKKAYERRTSLSAIVRETLSSALDREPTASAGPARFRFIGAGRSRQRKDHPVSVHHDEALATTTVGTRRRR